MKNQELTIDYFDKKYLDFQYPDRKNTPIFQLSGGDYLSNSLPCHYVVSKPDDFPTLLLDILKYLKDQTPLKYTYKPTISKEAFSQIGETGKKVLEEICNLHNDFVTPKRS